MQQGVEGMIIEPSWAEWRVAFSTNREMCFGKLCGEIMVIVRPLLHSPTRHRRGKNSLKVTGSLVPSSINFSFSQQLGRGGDPSLGSSVADAVTPSSSETGYHFLGISFHKHLTSPSHNPGARLLVSSTPSDPPPRLQPTKHLGKNLTSLEQVQQTDPLIVQMRRVG